jgi:hypothetical protein
VVSEPVGALELRGPADGLLDDPLTLLARGAGGQTGLLWRARLRDDDGRVWRATAERPELLARAWTPAKETTGAVAGLRSLRPVALDVRAEAPDGRAAARTFRRRLLADGVRVRRWKEGLNATLLLPLAETPCAAVVLDAGGGGGTGGASGACDAGVGTAEAAPLAAALLASRGVLVFAVATPGAADRAAELLAAVPAAARAAEAGGGAVRLISSLPLPPGVPARMSAGQTSANAAAWDALLAELGATPRAAG